MKYLPTFPVQAVCVWIVIFPIHANLMRHNYINRWDFLSRIGFVAIIADIPYQARTAAIYCHVVIQENSCGDTHFSPFCRTHGSWMVGVGSVWEAQRYF